jgi:uncharacterized protein (DUF885 family)
MSDAAQFDALLEEFYPVWLRFHPDRAEALGDLRFVDRYGAADDDEIGALISLLESLLVSLEELNFAGLDPDRQLDAQLILGACRLEHQLLLESDWRHRDPLRFLPLRRLHWLSLRRTEGLGEILVPLLDGMPEYLRHARSQLSTVPGLVSRISLAAALEEIEAGIPFLAGLAGLPEVHRSSRSLAQVRGAAERAAEALADLGDYMGRELAPSAWIGLGVGEERYRCLLRQRHFLPWDPEVLRRLVERSLESLERSLLSVAPQLGATDISGLEARLAARERLAGAERLAAAGEVCERLRTLAAAQGLASLPAAALRVAEKPSCVRPGLGELSYLPASGGGAQVLLAPLPVGEGETSLELLNRCLDAGWLGLHLLHGDRGDGAASLTRKLNPSVQFLDGWRIYVRGLMVSGGWLDGPEEAAALLLHNRAQMQRALLDLDLHISGVSYEEAVQRMQTLPGMSRERANFALTQMCREPGDAVAGAAGALLLDGLRVRMEDLGESHLGSLHDRLLGQGPVALPLVVRRAFGEPAWQELEQELVG